MVRRRNRLKKNYKKAKKIQKACQINDIKSFIKLISKRSVYEKFNYYIIPGFLNAIRYKNMEIVDYICKRFVFYFTDKKKSSSILIDLCIYPKSLETFRYIVNRFQIPTSQIHAESPWILHNACSAGNIDLIRYFCEDLHFTKDNFFESDFGIISTTHFGCACKNGHLEIVEFLVDRFSITMMDIADCGYSPLYIAIQEKNLDIIRYLCENLPHPPVEEYRYPKMKYLLESIFEPMDPEIFSCVCKRFKIDRQKILDYVCKNFIVFFAKKNLYMIQYIFEELDDVSRLNQSDAIVLRKKLSSFPDYYSRRWLSELYNYNAREYMNIIMSYLDCYINPKTKSAIDA